jgi:hypothetical protein
MSKPTIFVSVAAYCDPMLAFTLDSLRCQAADPSRIFVGVVEQAPAGTAVVLPGEWASQNVRWTRVDALSSRGPCWARTLAMALYQGEDWYLQIDSHTWFEPGWDEVLLNWGRVCAAQNPRSVITCYPNPFVMEAGNPIARPVTQKVLALVVRADAQMAGEHPVLGFEGVAVEQDEPVPGFHVGGGCLFAPGGFVQALPYDPQLYFHGEEQALALRAWTRGWDIWHVPGVPLYHLYTQPGSAPRPMHWAPEHEAHRSVPWTALDKSAQRRLSALVWGGDDLGVYGLGQVRSLAEYAAFSGIDYLSRDIAPRARKARFGY